MKPLYYSILITILLFSCGGDALKSTEELLKKGNLEELKEQRTKLQEQQHNISEQLHLLNAKIESMDSLRNVPLITTLNIEPKMFEHYLELQGSVATKKNLVLYPEMGGILTNVYVKEGQKVSSGQILAKIDDGGLSQQLAQLEIQANLAKTTFERQERLWEQKIGSEIQYLQTKSNYQAQAEAVNQLKSQLAKTTIRAPFSGTIDDIITEQGAVVAAGQTPVIRIVNLEDMYIETDVPEAYLNSVTEGKNVKVDFPILDTIINSKIRQAGNFIDPANRTYKVLVDVPNSEKRIKPNLTAKLQINDYSKEGAILIPQSIITENAEGEQYVYVADSIQDNKIAVAKRVIIKTGLTQGDFIEVVDGLNATDVLINEGARSVKDKQKVEILSE
ncbi:efflux RND transporter periplasmic adaptor subunit [Aegicerativicinus sediminis]|uniref:efflux RND transporter periplasmic adaptor subunit n=1 Tax=Aegicerativicinus sediminis TaxID=2893202 RepID=UPI001E53AA08|nr:efflux RND transporter periplasmic adaptor subunit [Aegicerativicinus sediminis]